MKWSKGTEKHRFKEKYVKIFYGKLQKKIHFSVHKLLPN